MQIYLISNKINGKNYVGQTTWNFETRYTGKKWWHYTHNNHLKQAAQKYGHENFEVKILWEGECTNDELTKLEDVYMKIYNSIHPHGYNFKEAGKKGRNYYNYKEYELIDANGIIYKITNLSQFCRQNNLSYTAMLNMVCGINSCSCGFALSTTPKELIIDPNQSWEIEKISTKEIFKIKRKDAVAFCEKQAIKTSDFYGIVNKKRYVSKGFKLKETVLTDAIRESPIKYKNIELINEKTGEELIINNIYKFCKNNNLSKNSFYDLIKGKCVHAYGFKLKDKSKRKTVLTRPGLQIKLKNIETNEIIEVNNVSEFCRQRGLKIDMIHNMIYGSIKQYKLWTLPERDLSNYKFPKKIISITIKNNDTGEEIIEKGPKTIQRKYKIVCSDLIYDIINGKKPNKFKEFWSIKNVKYKDNYYPEINY